MSLVEIGGMLGEDGMLNGEREIEGAKSIHADNRSN